MTVCGTLLSPRLDSPWEALPPCVGSGPVRSTLAFPRCLARLSSRPCTFCSPKPASPAFIGSWVPLQFSLQICSPSFPLGVLPPRFRFPIPAEVLPCRVLSPPVISAFILGNCLSAVLCMRGVRPFILSLLLLTLYGI